MERSSSVSYLFFHWRVCKKKPHIYNSCSALLAKKAHKVYVGFFISLASPFFQLCSPDLDIPEGGAIGLNLNFTSLDFFLPMCDDIHNPTFSFIP